MSLQAEFREKRDELARLEREITAKTTEREHLVPGDGYGEAKARLTEEIRQLTNASARLQGQIRTLKTTYQASLQPKLL